MRASGQRPLRLYGISLKHALGYGPPWEGPAGSHFAAATVAAASPRACHRRLGRRRPCIAPASCSAPLRSFYFPYRQSLSTSKLYYSYDVAGAHIIMLSSYSREFTAAGRLACNAGRRGAGHSQEPAHSQGLPPLPIPRRASLRRRNTTSGALHAPPRGCKRAPRRTATQHAAPSLPPAAAAYSRSSEQYAWLHRDLAAVDRARTPWVIVVFHAPWYNSNYAHQARTAGGGGRGGPAAAACAASAAAPA